jgi:DNA primase
MSSSVEKIKEKLDVQDVIGSYIKLEKAGGNFKATCPFHNEKTPSFFVSPSRGTYYCFGCGAKGDIFTFVQEFEGTDFLGSLKLLADRAGVELERTNPKERSEKERLLEVLDLATRFFEDNLKENKKAQGYLFGRGLNAETMKEWRLGYAPNEWRNLREHLKSLKVTDKEMERVGLIKKSDSAREDGYYDVFRGRIVFPIGDPSGKIIAFSGRIFDDIPDAPKYLNTPETELFNKSETLYGFDRAKGAIRKKDYTVLVEGQMDLLMCHQGGFPNTVASSGTAFTEAHLGKLGRLSSKILFVFDSDKAGFMAANKSAVLALSLGMEVKLGELPKGTDPAELIKEDIEKWKESLRNSKHLIDFYLDDLLLQKLESRKLAKEVEKKVLPYVAMLTSAIEQSHFVSQIAKKTGIREEAVWNDLRKLPKAGTAEKVLEREKSEVNVETAKRKNYIMRRILGILFWQEGEKTKFIDTDKLRISLIGIAGDEYVAKAIAEYKNQKEEIIFEAEAYYGEDDDPTKELEELLLNFEEDILREGFVKVMNELETAERGHDEKKSKELLDICQTITQKLAELSKKRIKE